MTMRAIIEHHILSFLCLSVLFLSGCGSENTPDQAASTQNQSAPVVSTAELFAGNPLYDEPMDRPANGLGLRDNPPLPWGQLLFVGNKLVTDIQREIWYTDLSVSSPTIKRIVGSEDSPGEAINPGACLDARLPNIEGIAFKNDGSIVGTSVTARSGNIIFEVKDPFGPNCMVTFLVGPTVGGLVNFGDADGPGATARFQYVEWPAVIDDNIYVIDSLNYKIKRIANDAAHTVTTVATLTQGAYASFDAMIVLNGKLYVVGATTGYAPGGNYITEIDLATGAVHDIIRAGHATFGDPTGGHLSGLATDGKGFFTYNRGYLFYVSLDGKVTSLAGDGTYFEFTPSYDPTRPQTAESVQLVVGGAGKVFLAFHNNAVYFSARAKTRYVERIAIK